MKSKIISLNFFERKPEVVGRDLIGKFLVRKIGKNQIELMITEVEAYAGEDDLASHARFGKTKRNEVMFGTAGVFYVYLIYGMYYMLNVVCEKKDVASAVLVRGVNGLNGPGKLTKNLKIDKSLNGLEAVEKSGLWFEDRGIKVRTMISKRIGVDYAGKWAHKFWRFSISERNIVK